MRGGSSSDIDVFDQIIMGLEYEPLNDLQPHFILDLGANIGLSSAWFLSRFPRAEVLAVEPDPCNFYLCCHNLARYGRSARVLLGAAWSKRSKVVLSHSSGDGREWASRVYDYPSHGTEPQVDAWDIASLIKMSNAKAVDLLKVDIERSELEVFARGYEDWLPLVRNICIELHDRECKEVFFTALANYDFDLLASDELTICKNLRQKRRTCAP
jgi:FkbM family methyltransferase